MPFDHCGGPLASNPVRIQNVRDLLGVPGARLEDFGHGFRDRRPGDPPGEERLDRDLVRTAEHGRRGTTGSPRGVGEVEARNVSRSGDSNVSVPTVVQSIAPKASGSRCGAPSARPIGSRMSGIDSCAIVAPSTNSTMPCTTDCGWTTTSMASKSTPNNSCASITSRPLFISVDESIVILAPMFQVGCASASAGCTSASSARRAPAERSAARGEHDARDLTHLAGAQRLPDRGVLGVDRHDLAAARRPRLGDDRARGDEALLVGEREALAGFERGERGGEAGEADDRVEDDVGVGVRGELGERAGVVEAGTREIRRHAELGPLLLEQVGVAPGGERDDAEVVAVAAQDVERLGADGPGRPEDDDAGGHGTQARGSSRPVPPEPGLLHRMLRWTARKT